MRQTPWVPPASPEADRPRDGREQFEHGVLVTLIAAIVVLAVLALGVSSSAVFGEPCDISAEASRSSCQAPDPLKPIGP